MTLLFIILIILVSVVLGLIVLVQNPKGGGLAGNIAGFSNQFMGVKQTTDVLEKGTWIFGAVIGLLCLFSVIFISKGTASGESSDGQKSTLPATTAPANNNNTAPVLPVNPTPTQPTTPNN